MPSDIKVCAEDYRTSNDIVVCTEDDSILPDDVKVCVDDGRLEECRQYSPLSVVGDIDCNVSDVYRGSGGLSPYRYYFDSGTIDQEDGEILSIDSCGASGTSRSGTITVSDACGQSATLEVRLPAGAWIYVDDTGCCPTCPTGGLTVEVITGTTRQVADYIKVCRSFPNLISGLCTAPCTVSVLIDGTVVCNSCDANYSCASCSSDEVVPVGTGIDKLHQEYHIYNYYWGCP